MSNKKILVVDDEREFLEVIKLRLEANNYDVITASDGKEGLLKMRQENPDAVLLDIMMPGINGLKILKTIRKENRDLPIFILTAYSDQKRFDKAKDLKASGFIVKTGDLSKEIENINNVLSMSEKYRP
ncbi:MAG: response regulator [Candidatus Omnitrophica bacterium]|nr:response regulator [Candidatus Omnitrophota bacterium]